MVWFTDHAISRYIERLRPALEPTGALTELRSLAQAGTITPTPPGWCRHTTADRFLRVGDDVCIPLHKSGGRTVAPTVMVRDVSPSERARRTQAHRDRRQARRYRRIERPGRPQPAPSAEEYAL